MWRFELGFIYQDALRKGKQKEPRSSLCSRRMSVGANRPFAKPRRSNGLENSAGNPSLASADVGGDTSKWVTAPNDLILSHEPFCGIALSKHNRAPETVMQPALS